MSKISQHETLTAAQLDLEQSLEAALSLLERRPAPGSQEERQLEALLGQVLAMEKEIAKDGATRPAADFHGDAATSRLGALIAKSRRLHAEMTRHPSFGDHEDGIGPTLGMDLRP